MVMGLDFFIEETFGFAPSKLSDGKAIEAGGALVVAGALSDRPLNLPRADDVLARDKRATSLGADENAPTLASRYIESSAPG